MAHGWLLMKDKDPTEIHFIFFVKVEWWSTRVKRWERRASSVRRMIINPFRNWPIFQIACKLSSIRTGEGVANFRSPTIEEKNTMQSPWLMAHDSWIIYKLQWNSAIIGDAGAVCNVNAFLFLRRGHTKSQPEQRWACKLQSNYLTQKANALQQRHMFVYLNQGMHRAKSHTRFVPVPNYRQATWAKLQRAPLKTAFVELLTVSEAGKDPAIALSGTVSYTNFEHTKL